MMMVSSGLSRRFSHWHALPLVTFITYKRVPSKGRDHYSAAFQNLSLIIPPPESVESWALTARNTMWAFPLVNHTAYMISYPASPSRWTLGAARCYV